MSVALRGAQFQRELLQSLGGRKKLRTVCNELIVNAPDREAAALSTETRVECVICMSCIRAYNSPQRVVRCDCSHMFHSCCFNTYVHFSNSRQLESKNVRCPICRRTVERIEDVTSQLCGRQRIGYTRLIQSTWRGYKVRKELSPMLSVEKNPILLRRAVAKAVTVATRQIVECAETTSFHIQSSFSHASRVIEDCQKENSRCTYAPHEVHWEVVGAVVLSRFEILGSKLSDLVCPICLDSLGDAAGSISMLPCAHVYHTVCVEKYEDSTPKDGRICALCRSRYSEGRILNL